MKGKEKAPAANEEKDSTEKAHESKEDLGKEKDDKVAEKKTELIAEKETEDHPAEEQSKEHGKLTTRLSAILGISTPA